MVYGFIIFGLLLMGWGAGAGAVDAHQERRRQGFQLPHRHPKR